MGGRRFASLSDPVGMRLRSCTRSWGKLFLYTRLPTVVHVGAIERVLYVLPCLDYGALSGAREGLHAISSNTSRRPPPGGDGHLHRFGADRTCISLMNAHRTDSARGT